MGDAPNKGFSESAAKAVCWEEKKRDACESLAELVHSVVFVLTQRIFEKIQDEKIDRKVATKLIQAVLGAGIEVVEEFKEKVPEIVAGTIEEEDDDDED